MGFLRGYEFNLINLTINKYLGLSKEIRFSFNCWNTIPDKEKHLHEKLLLLIGNKEKLYITKENITVESNLLTKEENERLNEFLIKYGNNLLDYEQRKVDFQNLKLKD